MAGWRGPRLAATAASIGLLLAAASGAGAQTVVNVATVAQLEAAVASVGSNTTIVIAPGTYALTETLTVSGPVSDVTIKGATGNRADVVILGPGLSAPLGPVTDGIRTSGAVTRLTVADLSLFEFPASAIVFDVGAQQPRVRNVHAADCGADFIQSFAALDTLKGADGGIVESSLVEYREPTLAPTSALGGVRVRGGADWVIRGNTFRRIWSSTDFDFARPAILANQASSGTLVEHNTIIDCQRGISLGFQDLAQGSDHAGGIVRNNVIYRSGALEAVGNGGDVAIHVADSPGTRVSHNTVLQGGNYPNSIEYRFAGATDVVIKNNLIDRAITARSGATGATIVGNVTTATAALFVDPGQVDLHLVANAAIAIDAGVAIVPEDGLLDLDGQVRPAGEAPDVGADEFNGSGPVITTASPLPSASTGVAYSTGLAATTLDNQWDVVGGALPPGLNLTQGISNAQVAGTPTATGAFRFRVRVTHVGSGAFAEKDFDIAVANPLPTLTQLTPSSVVAGSPGLTLTVQGTGFVNGTVVRWNGNTRPTTVVGPATMTVAIPASDLVSAGAVSVTVVNPPPGGGTSNLLTFTVSVPPPSAFGKTAPANGAVGLPETTTISWAVSAGAASYAYCVDTTDDGGCATWTSTGTSTSATIGGLAPATAYFWQARATNAAGTTYANGASSAFWRFSTAGTPLITSVKPDTGPLAGGTRIVIAGANLGTATGVLVGGVAAALDQVTPSAVSALSPAASTAGPRDVVLLFPGGNATQTGAFTYEPTTVNSERVGELGVPADAGSTEPALSGDGRYLAFVAASDSMLANDDNGVPDVLVRDRSTTALVRVSVSGEGTQANGASGRPRISADGRFVAFWSEATNLVPDDTNGVRDVFLHDRDADGDGVFDEPEPMARSTTRVSVASSGAQASGASAVPVASIVSGVPASAQLDLSPDGGWVAFRSEAADLVPGDTNAAADIFLHARTSGQTSRVSVAADGTEANGASQSPSVSEGGRRVAFASDASNLVPGDGNGVRDVFVLDRTLPAVLRLSEPSPGVDADGPSDNPSIDDAGVRVAAQTLARNLLPVLAASTTSQIVVFTIGTVDTAPLAGVPGSVAAASKTIVNISQVIASLNAQAAGAPQPGNGDSANAEICGGGGCLGYSTDADDITSSADDTNGVADGVMQGVSDDGRSVTDPVLVSRDDAGNQGLEPTQYVAVDSQGTTAALQSDAGLTGDTQGTDFPNVFVRGTPLLVYRVVPDWSYVTDADIVAVGGAGFEPGVQVLLGGSAVETFFDNADSLRFRTPVGGAPAVVDLTVRNPDGSRVVLARRFRLLERPANSDTLDTDQDGLTDSFEQQFGLDPNSAAGANGASGDPDGDGLTNAEELARTTHPRGTFQRFLAEGATNDPFFTTRISVANPSPAQAAIVLLRFQRSDGTEVPSAFTLGPLESRKVVVNQVPGMANAEFATLVESDAQVVVDRQMWWNTAEAYGTHAEGAVKAPSLVWYLAEGATHSHFDLFYLLQNPSTIDATVKVRYLLPTGSPLEKTYVVPANSRANIWVNNEQFPSGSGNFALAATDVSAVLEVQNNVPIIVERAMYLTRGTEQFTAGHESAGVTAPSPTWFLAEGATGPLFDLFVLLANPSATDAETKVSYLLDDGRTFTQAVTVKANSRQTLWVDFQTPDDGPAGVLNGPALSTKVEVQNGVPIIVERAMWWPGGPAQWYEAHNSPGSTVTGTRWGLADGVLSGPPLNVATYILLANTDSTATAQVTITLLYEDGPGPPRTFAVAPSSRTTINVAAEFPEAAGREFGALVESVAGSGGGPVPIVVERALYNDARGLFLAGGNNQLATRLQ